MDGARPFVVALHAGAFAREHRAGQRVAAAPVAAAEAVAGDQHHGRAAPARLGALGIGDALHRACGILGLGRERQQCLGRRRPALVVEIEVRPAGGQQLRRRDAGIGILRHRARHAHRALDKRAHRLGREVGRGDGGRALADEGAQPQVAAFAALELLALAQPLGDRDQLAADIEGFGGVRAGRLRPFHQVCQQIGVDPGGRRGLARGGLLLRFGHARFLRVELARRKLSSSGLLHCIHASPRSPLRSSLAKPRRCPAGAEGSWAAPMSRGP